MVVLAYTRMGTFCDKALPGTGGLGIPEGHERRRSIPGGRTDDQAGGPCDRQDRRNMGRPDSAAWSAPMAPRVSCNRLGTGSMRCFSRLYAKCAPSPVPVLKGGMESGGSREIGCNAVQCSAVGGQYCFKV